MSLSGDSDEREINKYQDKGIGGDSGGNSSSSDSGSSNEQYLSMVPRVPLKVL